MQSNNAMLVDERRTRLRGMAASLREELMRRDDLAYPVRKEALERASRWESEADLIV